MSEVPVSKPELYRQLAQSLRELLAGEHDLIANAANTAALIFTSVPDINWAGFSPSLDRFDLDDQTGIETLAGVFMDAAR